MNQDQVIGEILRHAADKEAHVADLKKTLTREIRKENAGRIEELSSELRRQINKRDLRVSEAEQVAKAQATVRVFDQNGGFVAEGQLRSVDTKTAKVVIQVGKDELLTLTFAATMPVPAYLKDAGQTYYGMEELLDFKVVSVPAANRWMVR